MRYNKTAMKTIPASSFRRDLRAQGVLARALFPSLSARTMRFFARAVRVVYALPPRWRGITSRTVYIPRPDGTKLRMYVFDLEGGGPARPALLWFHGGGFAFGSPLTDRKIISDFVKRGGSVVFSPCYTLSTDAPYPAALDDALLALAFVKTSAPLYNADPSRISFGGDSAGGGLAVSLALKARDENILRPASLLPVYPMLDDRPGPYNDAPLWNTASNRAAWALYLGGKSADKYAAPARETDLRGLPPAATYVGTLDPFLEETRKFIADLKAAGGDARLLVMDGCYHGFDFVPFSRAGQEARSFLVDSYLSFLAR